MGGWWWWDVVGRKVKLFCNFCSILYLSFFITGEFFRFLFFKPRKLYILLLPWDSL